MAAAVRGILPENACLPLTITVSVWSRSSSLSERRSVIPAGETSPTGPVWLYKPERHEEGADNLTPRPITMEGLKTEFRRARKRAGMKSSKADPLMGYRFHDNRHTGIT